MGRKGKKRREWKLPPALKAKRAAEKEALRKATREGFSEAFIANEQQKPLSKMQIRLNNARDLGYKDGYAYAENFWKAKYEAAEAKLASRAGAEANLKAARDFLSVAGQTIQAFAQVCLSQTDSQGKQA